MTFEKLALSNCTAKKNLGYSAAIAEAEDASEREAALALKRCCFNSLGLGQ
jgi:hypothetical protein